MNLREGYMGRAGERKLYNDNFKKNYFIKITFYNTHYL